GLGEGEVAVAAVAGAEQVLDQPLEALVLQPLVEVGDEPFLLARPDVIEIAVRAGLFEQRVVFLLGNGAGVVEDDQRRRVAVAAEGLVVLFDRLADLAQAIRGDHEIQVGEWHPNFPERARPGGQRLARARPRRGTLSGKSRAEATMPRFGRNEASGGEEPVAICRADRAGCAETPHRPAHGARRPATGDGRW